MKSLNHENIVQIYDSFTYDQSRKFAMILEYCDGGDLNKMIKTTRGKSKLIPESKIIDIFQKILDGLEYIHSKKIIHRDMKSLNIFLTKSGNIKIGDLGIAKVLLYSNCTNTVIGTPLYLAPEICKEKPYNEKSDIWSIGCVLYELLTFTLPFDAPNYVGLCKKILKGIYTPFKDDIKKFYSKELIGLMDLILQVDPEKRPSVKEIKNYEIFRKNEDNFNIKGLYKNMNLNSNKNIIQAFEPKKEKEEEKILKPSPSVNIIGQVKKRCGSAMVINNPNDKIEIKEKINKIQANKISKDDSNINIQQKDNFKKFHELNSKKRINPYKENKNDISEIRKQENVYNLIKDNEKNEKNNKININEIEKLKKKDCVNRYNNILCNLKNVYKESIMGNKGFNIKNDYKNKKREVKSSCDAQRMDHIIKKQVYRPTTPQVKKGEISSKRVRIDPKAKNAENIVKD